MSSKNNLFNNDLTSNILHFVENNYYNVVGVICQNDKLYDLPFISIQPGIHYSTLGDNSGQQYKNPLNMKKLPDLFVIGRAITHSYEPKKKVQYFNNM